jgi:hypothetical protein
MEPARWTSAVSLKLTWNSMDKKRKRNETRRGTEQEKKNEEEPNPNSMMVLAGLIFAHRPWAPRKGKLSLRKTNNTIQ